MAPVRRGVFDFCMSGIGPQVKSGNVRFCAVVGGEADTGRLTPSGRLYGYAPSFQSCLASAEKRRFFEDCGVRKDHQKIRCVLEQAESTTARYSRKLRTLPVRWVGKSTVAKSVAEAGLPVCDADATVDREAQFGSAVPTLFPVILLGNLRFQPGLVLSKVDRETEVLTC